MTAVEAQPLLGEQRDAFIVDDDVPYFNTASLAPLLRCVRDAGEAALERRSRPWTIGHDEWFTRVEELRTSVARLMGVTADHIALVPSSSYGLATIAAQLSAGPGDRVLVMDQEFPSGHHTWERFAQRTGAQLLTVRREPGQTWTDAIIAAVDERVAVAALPTVHWNNGALVDLERIAPVLRDAGAELVIDASQSLGGMPLDVARLAPAAVAAVGYKWLLGPYSVGYLYLDARYHDGTPLEENWINREGSDDFSALGDYGSRYRAGARRFDVGEASNFQLNPMASAGIAQVLEWTPERIAATLHARTSAIAAGAAALGIAVEPEAHRAPHFIGLDLGLEAVHRAGASLANANVMVSVRGRSLRVAPHLHVNDSDMQRLLDALSESSR